MTCQDWLSNAVTKLSSAGITTARLDCLVLLEDVCRQDRSRLLAHPELQLTAGQLRQLNKYIVQRLEHLPLAYIRGHTAFFGREFTVNTRVLVPRPESEVLIELLLKLDLPASPRLADVGTGSGCLGITAKLELPKAEVFLYDIDIDALMVAQANARLYTAAVHTARQDLLQNCQQDFDVILANLPYIPHSQIINRAAAHEPAQAIFSAGTDGLTHFRRFWKQIALLPAVPQHVITESLPAQHATLNELAQIAGYRLTTTSGYGQHFEHA